MTKELLGEVNEALRHEDIQIRLDLVSEILCSIIEKNVAERTDIKVIVAEWLEKKYKSMLSV